MMSCDYSLINFKIINSGFVCFRGRQNETKPAGEWRMIIRWFLDCHQTNTQFPADTHSIAIRHYSITSTAIRQTPSCNQTHIRLPPANTLNFHQTHTQLFSRQTLIWPQTHIQYCPSSTPSIVTKQPFGTHSIAARHTLFFAYATRYNVKP